MWGGHLPAGYPPQGLPRSAGLWAPRELPLDSQAHLEPSAGLAWALLSWKRHRCPSSRLLQPRTLDPLSRHLAMIEAPGRPVFTLPRMATQYGLPRKVGASGAPVQLRLRQGQSRSGAPSGGAECRAWDSTRVSSLWRWRRARPAWNLLDSVCQLAELWKAFCLDYYLASLQVWPCSSADAEKA